MCGLWYLVTWCRPAAGGSRGDGIECWHAAMLMAHHSVRLLLCGSCSCCSLVDAVVGGENGGWGVLECCFSSCVADVPRLALGWWRDWWMLRPRQAARHQGWLQVPCPAPCVLTPRLVSGRDCCGWYRCTRCVICCSLRYRTCWQVVLHVAMSQLRLSPYLCGNEPMT
jgi:hypothetical protein